MRQFLINLRSIMRFFGFDPNVLIGNLRGLPFYLRDKSLLKKQQSNSDIDFPFGRPYPILGERFLNSGTAKGHYFHQDLLVAKKIFENQPNLHVDVGSRVDGFVAHVSSFRKIEVLDIRPPMHNTHNIHFRQVDLMSELATSMIDYTDSISCLHALEHFGLGRYGDSVDFEGYLKGLNNLNKILKSGGKFYFSVPIGRQRIEFNAHRVFSVQYLIDLFSVGYSIDTLSYVDDSGDLHEDIDINQIESISKNFNCHYGCGIFELTKK